VQKIETGGSSNTSTPMFRYLANVELLPSEARHITHCASVDSENKAQKAPTKKAIAVRRKRFRVLSVLIKLTGLLPQAIP
jgi:hypothetical protein